MTKETKPQTPAPKVLPKVLPKINPNLPQREQQKGTNNPQPLNIPEKTTRGTGGDPKK